MAQLGNDTFTRANNASSWGTASDGQTWTVATGTATPAISGNMGTLTGAASSTILLLGSQTSADGEMLIQAEMSAANDVFSACLRCSADGTTSMYRASLTNTTSSGNFQLVRVSGGSSSVLASVTVTTANATFYFIRLRVIGSSQWAKAWQAGTAEPNTWALSAADTSVTGAGRFGVRGGPNSSSDIISFQSFYCMDYLNAESVPISDISGGSLQSWPQESASVSESAVFAQELPATETLTAVETLLAQETVMPTETLTAVETLLGTTIPLFTDALSASAIPSNMARWPVDALQISSTPLDWEVYQPTESNTVSETINMYSAPPPTENLYSFIDQLTPTVMGGVLARWPVDGLVIVEKLLGTDELHPSASDVYALHVFGSPTLLPGSISGTDGLVITDLINFFSTKLPSEVVAIIMKTRDGLLSMTARDAEITLLGRDGHSMSTLTRDGIGLTGKARDGIAPPIKTRG